jgi:hypothetical protein
MAGLGRGLARGYYPTTCCAGFLFRSVEQPLGFSMHHSSSALLAHQSFVAGSKLKSVSRAAVPGAAW